MAIIQITQTSAADDKAADDMVDTMVTTFKRHSGGENFTVGMQMQSPTIVQTTSTLIADRSEAVHKLNRTDSVHHIDFKTSPFDTNAPATASFTEYVQIWFPSSQVTPAFQQQIEDDFHRFDQIFKTESKGDVGLAVGWGLEEQTHENISSEKAMCFFVLRGWESMELFQSSLQNESYKRAIPILLGWNAPFKMWHVENRIRGGSAQEQR